MAAGGSAPSCSFKLLQPELLSIAEISEILSSKCVSMETIRGRSKEALVDLYRRVVLPLPQRVNWERNHGRNAAGKTNKIPITSPKETKGSGFTIGFNGSVETNVSSGNSSTPSCTNMSNSRLKPPPEVQNNRKKIRLNTSRNDSLENIVINKRRKSDESSQKDATVEPVEKQQSDNNKGNNVADTSVENIKKVAVEPKRVTLKRNFNQSVSVTTKTEESLQEKRQKSKITWP